MKDENYNSSQDDNVFFFEFEEEFLRQRDLPLQPCMITEHQMDHLLEDLKSLDDTRRRHAVERLLAIGESAFDQVANLLTHDVAKWEAMGLLTRLSPERAIPILLEHVRHNREISTRSREHSRKYIRIKAIEELGNLAAQHRPDIDQTLAANKVVEDLAYFIEPEHPHQHEEVHIAVVKALEKFMDITADQKVEAWKQYLRTARIKT